MNSTTLTLDPFRLVTARSKSFPDGNKEAFLAIESPLDSLRGRKFYGLVYSRADALEYFAALVPASESEEERFVELGFPVREIEGGRWARVKMHGWTSKMDEIGPTFGTMIEKYGIDPARPQMEFYRSLDELHLLLPIPGE
jgi:hypothetical protein